MIRALFFLTSATALVFTLGCGGKNPVSVSIKGSNSQTFIVLAGSEFTVTLGTVGSGEYSSPPTVSSGVVQFLDVLLVGPYIPAGPTQRFRFNAATRGTAIVIFQHTGMNRTVEDTVQVR
jgi:hypothetical protein